MPSPVVKAFFHEGTSTISYVVSDPESRQAAILDPVLDYNASAGRVSTDSVDALATYLAAEGLDLQWVLETHPHADHLSAGRVVRERIGGRLGIGDGIRAVQDVWNGLYNLGAEVAKDGSQFDRLFADGDEFTLGRLPVRVLHTPGHTPACVTYLIGDAAFVGDTLFMPDFGTARADFPGGDARQLYKSIQRILALPPETRIFTCHDYCPGGRELRWESTVAEQRAANKHVRDGIDEEAFVAMRRERDACLNAPALLLPSLQVNIRGGDLPPPDDNGTRYLRIPLNRF